jgi:hypothetical protein
MKEKHTCRWARSDIHNMSPSFPCSARVGRICTIWADIPVQINVHCSPNHLCQESACLSRQKPKKKKKKKKLHSEPRHDPIQSTNGAQNCPTEPQPEPTDATRTISVLPRQPHQSFLHLLLLRLPLGLACFPRHPSVDQLPFRCQNLQHSLPIPSVSGTYYPPLNKKKKKKKNQENTGLNSLFFCHFI